MSINIKKTREEKRRYSEGSCGHYNVNVDVLRIEIEDDHQIRQFLDLLKTADAKISELEKIEEIFDTSSGNKLLFARRMLDDLLDKIDEEEKFLKQL